MDNHSKAIAEINEKLAVITAELQSGDDEERSNKRLRATGRASSVDTGGDRQRDNLKMKIQDKLEKRVTISGFLENSSKDFREEHVNTFLTALGTAANYGEI